jgi:predicted CopG family antitoxin
MSRTVTITLEDEVFQRLQEHFGDEDLSQVIKRLLHRYTSTEEERAAGYAAMAADKKHEAAALAWIELAPDDALEDDEEDWSWLKPQ